jgi:tRNA 2-thiouridine synthesizing protein A
MSESGAGQAQNGNPLLLDTRGLLCPLPVIRTQDRIRQLEHGTELVVTATDPGVMHDIPAWCRVHGHELISATRDGRLCTITIRVIKG